MTKLPVFITAKAQARYEHAWSRRALAAVYWLCMTRRSFFADDIWDIIGRNPRIELRRLGAVLRDAAKRGWCKISGEFRRVKHNHSHLRHVWTSLLCDWPA